MTLGRGKVAIVLLDSSWDITNKLIHNLYRGLILGENSYGKWTVQNVFLFPGFEMDEFLGQLRVTVGETMTPLNKRYQFSGLKPDVQIPSAFKVKGDKQLRQGLQVLVSSGAKQE